MSAIQKLQDRLTYIDGLINATPDVEDLEYLTEARAAIRTAIDEPGTINIDGGVNIDLSTVSAEIEQASNLQNVSSLLSEIETAVDGLETLVNFTKSTGSSDANTIRVVLALNDFIFTVLGQAADASSATGSVHAKLRQINTELAALNSSADTTETNTGSLVTGVSSVNTSLGAAGDAASETGGVHAKLRLIANLLTPTPPTVYTSLGAAATANIKNTSTRLYSLSAVNLAGTTVYLQLFNSTSSTTTPVAVYPVYGNGGFTVLDQDYFNPYRTFSTGLTFGFSVQALSFEAATPANCILEVRYI